MPDSATTGGGGANEGGSSRERLVWLAVVAAVAALALRVGSAPPRDDDLAFVRTLLEVKGHLADEYVRDVDEASLGRAAIDGMLRLATDPFTAYVPPEEESAFDDAVEGRFVGVGVVVRPANEDQSADDAESGGLVVVRPIPDSPAAAAGLLAGDVIVSADGVDVRPLPQGEVIDRIKGPAGTTVGLGVERPGRAEPLSFDVERAAVRPSPIEGFGREPDGSPIFLVPPPPDAGLPTGELPRIGYVRLPQFVPGGAEATAKVIADLKADGGLDGLILDLRFNPGGLLGEAVQLADLFLDDGVIVWSEGEHSPRSEVEAAAQEADLLDLPLVVLIDRASASASEVFAGALSDHRRAIVVGERSYGKGSVQDVIDLRGGGRGKLKLTTAYYHLPGGRVVQRKPGDETWGIDPDVPAPIDVENAAPPPSPDAPPLVGQVWRAYETLVAQLAAEEAF